MSGAAVGDSRHAAGERQLAGQIRPPLSCLNETARPRRPIPLGQQHPKPTAVGLLLARAHRERNNFEDRP